MFSPLCGNTWNFVGYEVCIGPSDAEVRKDAAQDVVKPESE